MRGQTIPALVALCAASPAFLEAGKEKTEGCLLNEHYSKLIFIRIDLQCYLSGYQEKPLKIKAYII